MGLRRFLTVTVPLLFLLALIWVLFSGMSRNKEKEKTELEGQWNSILASKDWEEGQRILKEMEKLNSWPSGYLQQLQNQLTQEIQLEQLQSYFRNRMVEIPSGSYMMGSQWGVNEEMNDESPVHPVTVDSFYMFQSEFTYKDAWILLNTYSEQWTISSGNLQNLQDSSIVLDLDDRDSLWTLKDSELSLNPDFENYPLNEVSWKGAVFFCSLLSQLMDRRLRLPSEAEWEWAARGGSAGQFPYPGEGDLDSMAWHSGNSGMEIHRVMELNPNALGLYDMAGNVYEWCLDWYDFSWYEISAEKNPLGPEQGRDRVIRGGSYSDDPFSLRVSYRFFRSPRSEQSYLGFRPVLVE